MRPRNPSEIRLRKIRPGVSDSILPFSHLSKLHLSSMDPLHVSCEIVFAAERLATSRIRTYP
jgi:hypothetical protein